MNRVRSIVVVLLSLALALGACGGASDGGGPSDGGGLRDGSGGGDVWVGRHDTGAASDTGGLPDGDPDGGAVDAGAGGDGADGADGADGGGAPDGVDGRDGAGPLDVLGDGADAPGVPDGLADAAPDAVAPDASDAVGPPDIGQIACEDDLDCELALPFHDLCDRVWCQDGTCRIARVEDCCLFDIDCFDWDPCTVDRCTALKQCENAPVEDASCCSGEWRVRADFEEGLPEGWEIVRPEGARAYWQVSSARAATGDRALAFLEPESGGYGTGYREHGDTRGPWFEVPTEAEQPLFRFDVYLDTEWRMFAGAWADPSPLVYDRLTVLIDDGAHETEVWSSYSIDVQGHTCTGGCAFRSFAVDLGDFRGQRVRPVFRFDSGDHIDNDWTGAAIDNVGFELACGEPPECFSSSDCDDGDRCTDDACQGATCAHEKNYAPGCCYDFEVANWQFDPFSLSGFQIQPMEPLVRWHVSDRRAFTGGASLRFGHVGDATFDLPGEPVSGRAASPSVTLVPWVTTTLHFAVWVDTEPYDPVQIERDAFEVVVVTSENGDADVVWHRGFLDVGDHRTWVEVDIDLTQYSGQVVFLRFQFSSGDAEGNTGEGVYVDDVRLIRRCF